uniref:Uncharacterized protein n=1 Tax=Drosophila-associated filamentous virus TaxID=2743186 RepID=A0A6M9U0B1_9VIRU|nr:putative protein 49 [Drosophila-associated filamentous virus]
MKLHNSINLLMQHMYIGEKYTLIFFMRNFKILSAFSYIKRSGIIYLTTSLSVALTRTIAFFSITTRCSGIVNVSSIHLIDFIPSFSSKVCWVIALNCSKTDKLTYSPSINNSHFFTKVSKFFKFTCAVSVFPTISKKKNL